MLSTEIVVRAGHTNAESAKFWVSNTLVSGFWSARVFITAWIGIIQNHRCSQFQICLLLVIATLEYPGLDGISHVPSLRSLSLPGEKVITS